MKLNFKKNKSGGGGDKKSKRGASRQGGGDAIGNFKRFLSEHVEKLVLVLIAVVSLYLVYIGFSKEPLGTDPDAVQSAVRNAQSRINSGTWAEVKQDRFPEPDNFDQQATQDTISIDPAAYDLSKPFHSRLQQRSKRRSDPELLAPFDVEVKSGYGAIAIRSPDQDAGIASLVQGNSPDLRPLPGNLRGSGRGEVQLGGTYEERFFVALTGLVPYKQQFDLYQEAFKGASEHDLDRDVPKYMGLMIERAEVQPDGTLSEWEKIDTLTGMIQEPTRWEGRPEERAETSHLLPGLMMPLPPLVLRDVSQWSVHSTVPLAVMDRGQSRGEGRAAEGEPREGDTGQPLSWGDRGSLGGRGEGGGAPMRNEGRDSRTPMTEGGGNQYSEEAQPLLQVDNGMLRYFDFTVKPGGLYQYRVQALLEDPNNPMEGPKPSSSSCETDVLVRRQAATEPLRSTPWSEPSPAIRVPTGSVILADAVEAPSEIGVGPGRRIKVSRRPTDEPSAKLLTLTWRPSGPFDVPVSLDVSRGAVLNGAVAEIEAIDPSVGKVRKLKDYNYATNAMVLDIYGGFKLGSTDLTAPGFVLVMTGEGQLKVRSEVGDHDEVEANTIPPDEEQTLRAEEERNNEPRGEEEFREGGEEMRGPGRGGRGVRGGRGGR